jgi:hypothetical protein
MCPSAAIRPRDGANDKHRFAGRDPDSRDKLAAAGVILDVAMFAAKTAFRPDPRTNPP